MNGESHLNSRDKPNISNIGECVRIWVTGPEGFSTEEYDVSVKQLFKTARKLAKKLMAQAPRPTGNVEEPEDLAGDFMVWLKTERCLYPTSEAGLRREMTRYLIRSRDRASHELWDIVSTALHTLFKEGRARRLDDPKDEAPNSNNSIWTIQNDAPFNAVNFTERASSLPVYSPPGAKRTTPQDADDAEKPDEKKVISPAHAKKLMALLLEAAQGAIPLRDLFEEFKKHVFLFRVGPEQPSKEVGGSVDCDAYSRLSLEASVRARRIWEEAAREKLTYILCGYFIPKYLGGKNVSLESLGKPTSGSGNQKIAQFHHRKEQKLAALLQKELSVAQEDQSFWALKDYHTEFVFRVLELLKDYCAEKP